MNPSGAKKTTGLARRSKLIAAVNRWGHAIASLPQHDATATIARLVAVANKVQYTWDRTTILRIVNGKRRAEARSSAMEAEKSRKSRAERKTP